MKIIYDGNNLEKVVRQLPKGSSFLMMDMERWIQTGEEDFLYVLDDKNHQEKLEALQEGQWVVRLGKEAGSLSSADYPRLRFTKRLAPVPILPHMLHLMGPMEPIVRFVSFLLKENDFVHSYHGEAWKEEFLEEELLRRNRAFERRLRKERANLHLSFEKGDPEHIHVFFWDGKIESLFELAEDRKHLPSELLVVRTSLRASPLKEQSIVLARDLGCILVPGAMRKAWREILSLAGRA